MNTAALRQLIAQARQQEAGEQTLARFLQTQLERLHPSIRLPEDNASGALSAFVIAYIEEVPDVLDAAADVAREAGIEAAVKPVLKIAEQFFLQPPTLVAGHEGLEGLLDEAYLAHRLVEEVNDRYIAHLGQPLIPLDTTRANLIAHQLIGEPFANQLDEAVHHALAGMLDDSSFDQPSVQAYRERLAAPNTASAWQRWPCLSQQLGVELQLTA
ncbi:MULTISPECIES: hypothetical protein [Pseudomonas]|uniref:Uncharacterized protein n=2 Tax=Ectopseudomonas TaxID=3236654 RepID=A0A653B551_ECTOL|nr:MULTISPECIES: hypothetical protein [Pseudomonas]TNF07042.1 MAG: hypothetical protein EP327_15300 [Pseudomonadales bacterium]CAE6882444.1 conserved protein of unknown function [Pseudomonas oleovorans]QFT20080.1 hypothetical protein FIV02_00670 [Pseudomonas sp. THAF187a]QFT40271.1 hypothetical protein FIU98_00670 [Pseudomonas sp. THAF42]QTS86684.1 hypothetical protein JLK41_00550 [Pseudomonas khazarica]|tara:strand:+ start:1685 stop:2326 length:642 start_codon:yes stop_codon:yes gene_type:complete